MFKAYPVLSKYLNCIFVQLCIGIVVFSDCPLLLSTYKLAQYKRTSY